MFNKNAYQLQEASMGLVANICEPLKNITGFGFTWFGYIKIYNDCSFLSLMNGASDYAKKYCDSMEDHGGSSIEHIQRTSRHKPYVMIWPQERSAKDPVLSLLYEKNIWHGVSIICRVKDGVEIFAFAGDRENQHLQTAIVNNIEFVCQFIEHFKGNTTDLIKQCRKSDLGIHRHKYDISYKPSLIIPQNQNPQLDFEGMSPKEMQCLTLFCKGYTVKSIARKLNLSPRTAETHLNSIKIKTNTHFKDELVEKYHGNYQMDFS